MIKLEKNEIDELDIIFFKIKLSENFKEENLKKAIDEKISEILLKFKIDDLKNIREIGEFREFLKKHGIDPTKNRISMEALLRRVLKKGKFPHIFPLVDINNLLSLHLILPVCMYDIKSISPPLKLRIGKDGEKIDTLRGKFDIYKKPVLEDKNGPFGTPFIDDKRVLLKKEEKEAYGDIYILKEFEKEKYIKKAEEIISKIGNVSIDFFRGN